MGFCKSCGEVLSGTTCRACGSKAGDSRAGESFADNGFDAVAPKWSDRYLTTNLEGDLDTGLRNMANVRPEWVDKTCVRCKRACTDGAFEAPSGDFRGKPLCNVCFGVLFKIGTCAGCHGAVVPDGTEYIKQDDQIFHVHCFTEERRCHVCRQPILNQAAVNALGHDYHAKCFACGICQTQLDSNFVAVNGVPQCSACAADAATRRTARKSTTTTTVGPSEADKAAAAARNDLNKAVDEQKELLESLKNVQHINLDDVCLKCKEPMLSNGIAYKDGYVHEECFVCKACGKDFPDRKFVDRNGDFFHAECAAKAAGNVCRVCRKPVVSGKVVEHGGGKLHADCFGCGECSKALVGVPFGEKDGVAYCQTCMVSKARAPVKGTTTGAYTPGITVNPVTGATEQRSTAPTAGGAMIGARTPGLGTKDRCPKCDQAVYMGPDKTSGPMNTTWHKRCLVCTSCHKQLDSMAVLRDTNKPYCGSCARKL